MIDWLNSFIMSLSDTVIKWGKQGDSSVNSFLINTDEYFQTNFVHIFHI